jgi:hypothetical protein
VLVAKEASFVLAAHRARVSRCAPRVLAGVEYLEIVLEQAPEDLPALLGSLSATFAVFEPVPADAADAGPLLRPVAVPDPARWDSSLETTLRYPGKTNEQFTALLLNLAAALSRNRRHLLDGTLRVLDPLCGRGTTLNRALRLGLSPVGVDVDDKDLDAYRTFLLTWAKQHHVVHTSTQGKLTVPGGGRGTRFTARLSADRATAKAGSGQEVTVLGCDTTRLDGVLRRGGTDAIVGDLPYGVQHGSRAAEGWQRSPVEVLRRALPGWRELLRQGGGMALALNRHTARRSEVSAVMADAGFEVLDTDGAFRHRVDQAIDRDVVLAVRDDHPELDTLHTLAGTHLLPSPSVSRKDPS